MPYSDLTKTLRKIANTTISEMAEAVSADITAVAQKNVNDFYEEYTPDKSNPNRYIRTKNLKNKAVAKYKEVNLSDNSAEAGVRISADKMHQNYHIDKAVVVDLALNQGIHGLPGGMRGMNYVESIMYHPSTVQKTKDYVKKELDLQKYFQSSLATALGRHSSDIENL